MLPGQSFQFLKIAFYQSLFLCPGPTFYLFFGSYGVIYIPEHLRIHTFQGTSFMSIALFKCALLVFFNALFDIVCYAGIIQSVTAPKNIYVIFFHKLFLAILRQAQDDKEKI